MGKTIFISSHILPELADICNVVGIIEVGKLLACGSIDDFVQNIQSKDMHLINIRTLEDDEMVSKVLSDWTG